MRRTARKLEWTIGELGATADHGWFSAWIEPLLGEGEGRFAWSVDTPEAADPEKLMNLAGGVEPSLQAAMSAASEVMVALDSDV